MRLEIEQAKSRLEEAEADVEQSTLDAGDTSREAAEARLRSAPPARSFWSRLSGSTSPQASTYPAEDSTTESSSPEAVYGPAPTDAESAQPVVEPSTPDFHVVTEVESEADPAPEPSVADTVAVPEEPETPDYPASSASASDMSGFGSASPQSPAPAPAPAPPPAPAPMHDVRLIVQAVESAEGAAMDYAREIGEARRHLSEAIAHLDQADAARTVLNRLAAGFGSQG
jgi:hypothetical protein